MSKPYREVELRTYDGETSLVRAVFDTGSHPTIVREDVLPKGTLVIRRPQPAEFRTAATGGVLHVVGSTVLLIAIDRWLIEDRILVSPDLSSAMLVGAGTMQQWDISILNENGSTSIVVGHDLNDPDIQEID